MVRTSQKPPTARKPDTGVWPCTLDGCSKVFAREADLKRHQRTTKSHSIPGSSVGSPCPLCDATFTRSDAMRRHLKSRHGGKTPETLTVQDTQASTSASSAARGKQRAYSPEDASELSGSDGERGDHSRTISSRAPSAAPPQYYHSAAPPPLPQAQQNLSPAILYQAAMHATTYEIQHALSPRPSTHSSPSISNANTPVTRDPHEGNSSRRGAHPHGPMQPGYQQFPADDYYGPQPPQAQTHPSSTSYNPYGPPPSGYTTSGGSAMYGSNVYASPRSPAYVSAQAAGSRTPFRSQEPPPSGLAALAMHASQIRPLSPLPKQKTKSELESALGPPYAR